MRVSWFFESSMATTSNSHWAGKAEIPLDTLCISFKKLWQFKCVSMTDSCKRLSFLFLFVADEEAPDYGSGVRQSGTAKISFDDEYFKKVSLKFIGLPFLHVCASDVCMKTTFFHKSGSLDFPFLSSSYMLISSSFMCPFRMISRPQLWPALACP